MNKKKDPRTKFIPIRVTATEKQRIIEDAYEDGLKPSAYIRAKLGLRND